VGTPVRHSIPQARTRIAPAGAGSVAGILPAAARNRYRGTPPGCIEVPPRGRRNSGPHHRSDRSRLGPGSFTGIRAGLAFARGLGRAIEVPLVAVARSRQRSQPCPPRRKRPSCWKPGEGSTCPGKGSRPGLPTPAGETRWFLVECRRSGLTVLEIGSFDLTRRRLASRRWKERTREVFRHVRAAIRGRGRFGAPRSPA